MSRRERIHIPGGFYHVTLRGNSRKRIFFDDDDRVKFCLLMQEGVERFGHRVHAFCLMNNHVHILVQAGEKPIGKAMQNLAFRYSRKLNKKFKTTGHRFQGRYYSGIIDTDAYLHEAIKYIHLNPVRANMIDEPSKYYWSSHCHYLYQADIPWVERDFALQMFNNDLTKAVSAYDSFMETAQSEEIASKIASTSHEYIIGDDKFIENTLRKTKENIFLKSISIADVLEASSIILGEEDIGQYKAKRTKKSSHIRGIIGYLIMNYTDISLAKFAVDSGKSASTVSRSIIKIESTIVYDKDLQAPDVNGTDLSHTRQCLSQCHWYLTLLADYLVKIKGGAMQCPPHL